MSTLFLHGFMGRGEVCLPGHGDRVGLAPHAYEFEHAVRAIAASIHEPVALGGYSMGGRIALGVWARFPEKVRSLHLVSCHTGHLSHEERQQAAARNAAVAQQLRTVPLDQFLDAWYEQALFASLRKHSETLTRWKKQCLQNDPEELARAVTGMGVDQQPDFLPLLAEVQVPVRYLAGERDEKYVAQGALIQESNPSICVEIVPETGHHIALENPDFFNQWNMEMIK